MLSKRFVENATELFCCFESKCAAMRRCAAYARLGLCTYVLRKQNVFKEEL